MTTAKPQNLNMQGMLEPIFVSHPVTAGLLVRIGRGKVAWESGSLFPPTGVFETAANRNGNENN